MKNGSYNQRKFTVIPGPQARAEVYRHSRTSSKGRSLQSFQDLKQGQGVEVYSHSRTSNKCSLFKVTYSAVVPGGVPKLMARNSHPISENDKVYTVVLKHNHI